ncbi:unnamed protein product [Closterium sp. NIES-64]|nr:unnamed protein product [Closterium sp. NIES-64]
MLGAGNMTEADVAGSVGADVAGERQKSDVCGERERSAAGHVAVEAQLRSLGEEMAIYDGDTPHAARRAIRGQSRLILSNPDMLHVTMLPGHRDFIRFLSNLRFVVVDEAHAYRGAFGCHAALIFRRLRRLCAHGGLVCVASAWHDTAGMPLHHFHSCKPPLPPALGPLLDPPPSPFLHPPKPVYGSDPIFIVCSATCADPKDHVRSLLGVDEVTVVDGSDDGSPCGRKSFVLWNPPITLPPVSNPLLTPTPRISGSTVIGTAPPLHPASAARLKEAHAAGAVGLQVRWDCRCGGTAGCQASAPQLSKADAAAAATSCCMRTRDDGQASQASPIVEVALLLAEVVVQHNTRCSAPLHNLFFLSSPTLTILRFPSLPSFPHPLTSPIVELSLLLAEMVQHDLRCLAFCKTRKLSELQGGVAGESTAFGGHSAAKPLPPASSLPLPLPFPCRAVSHRPFHACGVPSPILPRPWVHTTHQQGGAAGESTPSGGHSAGIPCHCHPPTHPMPAASPPLVPFLTAPGPTSKEVLRERAPHLVNTVLAYRAGYTAQDRRHIERELFHGRLRAVAATSALELGVDVGALDATLHLGFHGSTASLWQQAGRAGRREKASLSIYVAFDGPLDQYFMAAPERLFSRPIERCQLDAENPLVMRQQLQCAAAELPLLEDVDGRFFGPSLAERIAELAGKGVLGRSPENPEVDRSWRYIGEGRRPAQFVPVRAIDPNTYAVVETRTGRVLEEIEESKAFFVLYEGAVYLQQGRTFLVTSLDLEKREARCVRADVRYYTKTIDMVTVTIKGGTLAFPYPHMPSAKPASAPTDMMSAHTVLNEAMTSAAHAAAPSEPMTSAHVAKGSVLTTAQTAPCEVTARWTGYRKMWRGSGEPFETVEMTLPDVTYATQAVWVGVAGGTKAAVEAAGSDYRASLHAAAHALANMVPLHSTAPPSLLLLHLSIAPFLIPSHFCLHAIHPCSFLACMASDCVSLLCPPSAPSIHRTFSDEIQPRIKVHRGMKIHPWMKVHPRISSTPD